MKLTYNRGYLLAFFALVIIETIIALKVNDRIIRPYGGDTLAVVLLYTLARSFRDDSRGRAICGALAIACAVEVAQYLQVVSRLGMEHNRFVRTVLGTTFHWGDMLAYLIGAIAILAGERLLDRSRLRARPRRHATRA